MLVYPVTWMKDTNGSFLVEVPDLPEAHSIGDDEDEALLNVADAIETALAIYFDERRPIQLAGKAHKARFTVALPSIKEVKVLLWNEMQA